MMSRSMPTSEPAAYGLGCAAAVFALAVFASPCVASDVDRPAGPGVADRACFERTLDALGAEVATLHDARPGDRGAAARLGLDDRLQVVAVDAGSAAAAAGLRVGDRIVALDGQPLSGGPSARIDFLRRAERWNGVRTLAVLRDGATLTIELALRRACTVDA